ncbi:MAG: type II secretion system F family protein [Thermodesulfobacteriota bacterium]
MPHFSYKAVAGDGKKISGTMEADTAAVVQNILAQQGLIPVAVNRAGGGEDKGAKPGLLARLSGVKLPELLMFTKQINTLLRAGLSITRALEVLDKQSENPLLKHAIGRISENINQGASISGAFGKHPSIFSPLYCNLINAGELSGALNKVLERLSYILEHEHKVREDIKSALAYPKMVLIALGGAFFFLLTFVIPKFVSVFESAKLELPLPTKICITLYALLSNYWPVLLGGAVGLVVALKMFFKTENGAYLLDRFLLRLPIVGPLFVKTAMSRFASILSILLASGVSILDAFGVISETIGNAAITKEFNIIREHMKEGHGISKPLRKSKFFPPMVVNMIAIGEESGSLEEMLHEIARHYDEEVEYAVKNLSEAIGPILIVGLTAVVGFFALAIFLPMWDLTKMVK